MQKSILFGAVLLWATVLLAGSTFQPLNVKTGLWQVIETSTASGLPPISPDMQAKIDQMTPEQRARMEAMMKSRYGGTPHTTRYQKCVTTKELNTNAFMNGPDEKCTWTVLSSTGSEMEVRGTSCAAGRDQGMETDLNIKVQVLDSESVKAAVQGTSIGNGHTMNINGTFTGKWIGASCPAGTD
jgi:Protein of unknown function (DUF3617)